MFTSNPYFDMLETICAGAKEVPWTTSIKLQPETNGLSYAHQNAYLKSSNLV